MAEKMRDPEDEETFPVASNPEQEKRSSEFLKEAQRSKDGNGIISVSPGKQYVRGDTKLGKRVNALNAVRKDLSRNDDAYVNARDNPTQENKDKLENSRKSSRMLWDAYKEEADKGMFKKGGMVSMKGGGSVRGAGVAQRGQGKMRMF